MIKREKMLDQDLIKDPDKLLNKDILKKLSQYRIMNDEYRLKMGKYHAEGREGVPYCMLIIKKLLGKEEQVNLEMELRMIDPSLCVIFKK
ncbi:MAG TPA: hypothetical protein VMC84_02885 [Methanocella sp.]|uniref:hypothetical protein n=1 Tax=Methanocella sp. TaxID=2052833 RepID=UPI002C8A0180|nr:hypothetical protein [Methanocella sp.]HTY90099.1 hypothetical protein [Methanocella sp.]